MGPRTVKEKKIKVALTLYLELLQNAKSCLDEKKTNISIIKTAIIEKHFSFRISERISQLIGDIVRRGSQNFDKPIVQDKTESNRTRGRTAS